MTDTRVVLMLEAVKTKLIADRQENLAIAAHYLTNSVGVGEHPQIVESAVEAIKKACEADECLQFIRSSRFANILDHTTGVGKFLSEE